MEQQQQKTITLEEYTKQIQKEKELKEFKEFKERMVGKHFGELSIKEKNWLYKNQRLVYENLISDREYKVPKFI